jgi:hypothetical protein
MRVASTAVVLVALVLASAVMVACGGDDGEDPLPTAAPVATEPVPFASPTIEGGRLTSIEKGYAVTFPEGWNIRPNYVNVGSESLDAAFLDASIPTGPVRPTITIGCVPKEPDGPPTQEEFQRTRLEALTATSTAPPETTSRQVSGIQAAQATYAKAIQADPTAPLDLIRQQDIFFVGDLCAFSVSLLSSPEDVDTFQPQFDALLASFELIP